jgi:2-(1,2-epoxy-1,2-dihydrophenyl)acetyl-CoA isomerase
MPVEYDGVRCVAVTGSGRAFCSGEDLGPLAADYRAGRAPDLGATLRNRYNPLVQALRSMPKPTLAAINGVAAGAGFSLALACDFRIAAERAKLVPAFVKIGLVPDSGALWFLTRSVGVARALELATSGDPLTARAAAELGLVTQVIADDEFDAGWRAAGARLARGPTRALAAIKNLTLGAAERPLEEQLAAEADAQAAAGRTHDHLEGVQAFFDKRPPDFSGR